MSVGTVDNAGLRVSGHPRLAELGGQSSAELPEGADSSKGEISVVDGRANVLTILRLGELVPGIGKEGRLNYGIAHGEGCSDAAADISQGRIDIADRELPRKPILS